LGPDGRSGVQAEVDGTSRADAIHSSPRDRESHQFEFVADVQRDLEALPERCAMFSRILWWKTVTLQTAPAILLFATRI